MRFSLLLSFLIHLAIMGFLFVSFPTWPQKEIIEIVSFPVELVSADQGKESPKTEKNTQPIPEETVPLPSVRPHEPKKIEKTKPLDILEEKIKDTDLKPSSDEPAFIEPSQDALPEKVDFLPKDSSPLEASDAPQEQNALKLPKTAPIPLLRALPSHEPEVSKKDMKKKKSSQDDALKKENKNSLENQISALLNKEKSSSATDSSKNSSSLGNGNSDSEGQKLSHSEMDVLRKQIQFCWNVPAGILDGENLIVSVRFRLTREGEVDGAPEVLSGGGNSGIRRAAAESARRAILKCAPYKLPPEKYHNWKDVTVNFDPRDMF